MLVMARERRLPLLDVLESCSIEVLPVCDCNEAHQMLEAQPPVQVVVTDTALPDGDWRRVLEIVVQGCANIEVVVCSRLGDPQSLARCPGAGWLRCIGRTLRPRGGTANS